MLDLIRKLREGLSKPYTVKTSNPGVTGTFEVYPDASGAPAVLSYNGFKFSFDMLGQVKSNRLGHVSGKERATARKAAISVLEKAYQELLKKHTDSEWMDNNKKMYKGSIGEQVMTKQPTSEIEARSKLKKLSKEMEKYRHDKEQAEARLRELESLTKQLQTWLDTYYEAKGQRPKKPALKGH